MISEWYDTEIFREIKVIENNIIEDACKIVVKEAKDSMVPGNYKRSLSMKKDGSYHWSSRPGSPPAPDTEELKDSVSYATSSGKSGGIGSKSRVGNISAPSATQNESVGRVGTNDIKGLWQELGTDQNPEPNERPFLRPALANKETDIMNLANKHKI